MNIQELATLAELNLNIKIVVMNNRYGVCEAATGAVF